MEIIIESTVYKQWKTIFNEALCAAADAHFRLLGPLQFSVAVKDMQTMSTTPATEEVFSSNFADCLFQMGYNKFKMRSCTESFTKSHFSISLYTILLIIKWVYLFLLASQCHASVNYHFGWGYLPNWGCSINCLLASVVHRLLAFHIFPYTYHVIFFPAALMS